SNLSPSSTMRFPIYIIDAFTSTRFNGNAAAVFLSKEEHECSQMLRIAAEFNLSETAFPVPLNSEESFETARAFSLRYFSPKVEVPLCGHATLSAAHVLFNEIGNAHNELEFHTKGGVVTVARDAKGVRMNFPVHAPKHVHLEGIHNERKELFEECESVDSASISKLIHSFIPSEISIISVALAADTPMLIIEIDPATTKQQLRSINPDFAEMIRIHSAADVFGIATVTVAPLDPTGQGFVSEEGTPFDYASRVFAPWIGINEDPATGASHCSLGPYCSAVLGKEEMNAFQCFPNRGAQFKVSVGQNERRVDIVGSSVTVVRGEVEL
ncbi:hypothetical protein PMAYCL1PPCAC_16415, partial [Pristionchus mayeri]